MPTASASPLLRELKRRLKIQREARRLTHQQVYAATGIHVGRLETGPLNVTITTLATLCRFYGLPLAELLRDLDDTLDI